MSDEKKKTNLWPFVLIFVVILAGTLVVAAVKRQAVQETGVHLHLPLTENIKGIDNPKPSLSDIINARTYWNIAYRNWIGKPAPDFTVTDLSGKVHKLSDYRGKNVMLVFWATWCGPCITEVPHIKALNNILDEDKLKILAISHIAPNNPMRSIKAFAKELKVNYTIVPASLWSMPAPFNRINNLPSSFFIDPEGNIKLATEGILSLGEMKAIVLAGTQ